MNIENLREDLTNAQKRISQARLAVQGLWMNVEMPNGELDTSIYLLTQQLVEASHDVESALQLLGADASAPLEPVAPDTGDDWASRAAERAA